MTSIITKAINELKEAPAKLYLVYLLVYIPFGFGMNEFGKFAEIAKFNHWWQVFTCYGLYMIPISIWLRKLPYFRQYAYGLIAMGILEFCGSFFDTSYAYPNNLVDQFFGVRNYTLGLSLFFATYFPLGNWAVYGVYNKVFRRANNP